eukprot:1195925-Prorocentrum_minimum.AAC.4
MSLFLRNKEPARVLWRGDWVLGLRARVSWLCAWVPWLWPALCRSEIWGSARLTWRGSSGGGGRPECTTCSAAPLSGGQPPSEGTAEPGYPSVKPGYLSTEPGYSYPTTGMAAFSSCAASCLSLTEPGYPSSGWRSR